MQGRFVNTQPLVCLQIDLRHFLSQAQHIGVDGVAFDHHFRQFRLFIHIHRRNHGIQGGVLLAGNTDANIRYAIEAFGGIQATHGVKAPGKTFHDAPRQTFSTVGHPYVQQIPQLRRRGVLQSLLVQIQRHGGCAGDKISVLFRRDGFKTAQLGGHPIPLGFQFRNGGLKTAALAGGHLQPVLGQQKLGFRIQHSAVGSGVQLIQQIIQSGFGLGGQKGQIIAGRVLGLGQQINAVIQPDQLFSGRALGIIRIFLSDNGPFRHSFSIFGKIPKVTITRHIDRVKHNKTGQIDAVGHGIDESGFGFVFPAQNGIQLYDDIRSRKQKQQGAHGKGGLHGCVTAFFSFRHGQSLPCSLFL